MQPIRDWSTAGGAAALAEIIRGYWADRGVTVNVWVEAYDIERALSSDRRGVWGVRSDLAVAVRPTEHEEP